MKFTRAGFLAATGFIALLCIPATTWAQVAPPLGTAQQFGVLGAAAVTGATGSGVVVNGDVGSSPTPSITNFLPSRTASPFVVHTTSDTVVQQAHSNASTAYDVLAGQGAGSVLPANLATVGTLTPGVYSFVGGVADLPATATLTLDGSGVFIFNVESALTMNVLSHVAGTANPCNIYWRIGSSATLNGVNFWGTVIANTSVTVGDGANVFGRTLALTGAVTMAGSGGNTIGGCSVPVAPLCPTISGTPTTVPNGTLGVAYAQTLTASGGSAPYSFSVVSGTLPPGLTLTAGGVLAGTPTAAGSSTVTIRMTDGNACAGTVTYTIVIAAPSCPAITLSPPGLPAGIVGVAYSGGPITASGGTGPYTFSIVSGGLPAGLTLASTGLISGTPTATGTFTVTVRATDGNACPGVTTYTIVIASSTCPAITLGPSGLPGATVGVAYSVAAMTASGGTGPYTFSVLSGSLPAGLTLSSAGLISGTPTAEGSSVVTIRATDGNACPGVITFTINVAASAPGPTCVPASSAPPTISNIPNQVIPAVPANGSVAVSFTIGGAIITDALIVSVRSSDSTLVPASLMVITKGVGGARVLTIFAADGRSGVATITVTVTDPTVSVCTLATSTSFQLSVGTVPVPTLPQWAMIGLAVVLGMAGFAAIRRRAI